MGKICGIYKLTSPTGKVYVGQSKDIKRRFKQYKRLACEFQPKLYASLSKHGPKNHAFDIIEVCDNENLNMLEREYIKSLDSFDNSMGMNLRLGGDAVIDFSKESRAKMRESSIGIKKENHKSKFIGVYPSCRGDSFASRINIRSGVRKHIGTFEDEMSAAYAYDMAVIKYHKSKTPMNFTHQERYKLKHVCQSSRTKPSSTKYKGVTKSSTKSERYVSKIVHNGKRLYLGTFKDSFQAALYRDLYIIKHSIDKHELNFSNAILSDKLIDNIEKTSRRVSVTCEKPIFSSKYHGVTVRTIASGIRYDVSISVNYKPSYIGRFYTEKEAAQAYNNYIIEHNLNRKLNNIT